MNKQLQILTLIAALGFSGVANTAPVSGQGTWETTLQGRDLDGNLATFEAWYDTALNATWLADANYAQTSGHDANGQMIWADANAWATSLNINGYTGWRLPTVTDTGTLGCNFAYSGTDCGYNVDTATGEMAHMFYTTLGNKASYDTLGVPQTGYGLSNTGPFSNIQSSGYWSGTEFALTPLNAWGFAFHNTYQQVLSKSVNFYSWAVHPGDIAVVPVPPAVLLFGSGLLGLFGIARRKTRAL